MFEILIAYVIVHNMIVKDEFILNLEPCFEKHTMNMGYGLAFYQYKDGWY